MPLTNDMLRTSQLADKDTRPQRGSIREKSYSDEVITPESALTVSAVIAIITSMAQDLSSIPLFLYARRGRAKFRVYDNMYYRLMHDQPNPEHTSMVFREMLVGHLIAWGNFFAQKIIDGQGNVVELWPLRPDRMTVKRFEGERVYLYTQSDGKQRIFLQEEILHIPAFGFDGLVGYSRIALARNAIGLAISTEKFGSKFFANGAQPGLVYKHPSTLSDEAYTHLQGSLEQRAGTDNSHKTIILEENMSVEKIGLPNNDSQFLETRAFQLQEINRILGPVPPFRIADVERSTSWGTGIDSQEQGYINHTLLPYGVRIEEQLNSQILLESDRNNGLFYEHLFDGFLRGDIQTRYAAYQIGLNNRFFTPNEVRAKENLNPYKGGDTFYGPLNMAPINESPSDANAALEPLWKDAIGRVMKREANDLSGAAKRWLAKGQAEAFDTWARNFYRHDHVEFMGKQFQPLLDAELRLFGADFSSQMHKFISTFLQSRLEVVRLLNAEQIEDTLGMYMAGSATGILKAIESWRAESTASEITLVDEVLDYESK